MTVQEVVAVLGPLERRVDRSTGQNSLHATTSFPAGKVISAFSAGATQSTPNMYTVQVSEKEHIDLSPEILQYANHSCNPSVFFNTSDRVVEALEDIAPGDAITFFYPSTELRMESPFQCTCGASCCLGNINGAAHLSKEVLDRYKLNSHIKMLLEREHSA